MPPQLSLEALSRHRRLIWAAGSLLVVYAIVGFLVLPPIVRSQAVTRLAEETQREVSLERVRVNPFTLGLSAEGFSISDPGEQPVVAFDRLSVNLSLSSIFHQAWVLEEVELIEPVIRIDLDEQGQLNLAMLLPAEDIELAEDEIVDEEGGLVPILLRHASVEGGAIEFADRSLDVNFIARFSPIAIEVVELQTRGEEEGRFGFTTTSDRGETLSVSGRFDFDPISLHGSFGLSHIQLSTLWEYGRGLLDIEPPGGEVEISASYMIGFDVQADGQTALSVVVDDGQIALRDASITARGDEEPLITLPSFWVRGFDADLGAREVHIESIDTKGARIRAWLEPDGRVNYESLLVAADEEPPLEAEPETEGETEGDPWRVQIGKVALEDWALALQDRSVDPPAPLTLAPLSVSVEGFDTRPGETFALGLEVGVGGESADEATAAGQISLQGRIGLDPAKLQFETRGDALPIPLVQPYLRATSNVTLAGGTLSFDGAANVEAGEAPAPPHVSWNGNASLDALSVLGANGQPLLAWQKLGFDTVALDLSPDRLSIGEVRLRGVRTELLIEEDGSSNYANAYATGEHAAVEASGVEVESMPVVVKRVRLEDGLVGMRDRSVSPPFSIRVDKIEADIAEITSAGERRSPLTASARVDGSAAVKVKGAITPFDAGLDGQLSIQVQGIGLPPVSPYSSEYVGYGIEQGKLFLDLDYEASGGKLTGENGILVDRFDLGGKSEAESAPNLPIPLAIALLQDRDKKIEIDMVVHGDLADPNFSFLGLISKTLLNIMTKAVTSPFSAIAGVAGGGGKAVDDLESIRFEFGSAELDELDREKLELVARGLEARPKLLLEVAPTTDPLGDEPALGRMMLWQQIGGAPLLGQPTSTRDESARAAALADGSYANTIAKRYKKRFGEPLIVASAPPAESGGSPAPVSSPDPAEASAQGDAAGPPDELLRGELRLAAELEVPAAELRRLARDRAAEIRRHLVEDHGVEPERVFVLRTEVLAEGEDDHAVCRLQVNGR